MTIMMTTSCSGAPSTTTRCDTTTTQPCRTSSSSLVVVGVVSSKHNTIQSKDRIITTTTTTSSLTIESWTCEQVLEWIQQLDIHHHTSTAAATTTFECECRERELETFQEVTTSTMSTTPCSLASPSSLLTRKGLLHHHHDHHHPLTTSSSTTCVKKHHLHSLKDAIPYFKFHSLLGVDVLDLSLTELEEMFYGDFSSEPSIEEEDHELENDDHVTENMECHQSSLSLPIPCDPSHVHTRQLIQTLYTCICNLKQQYQERMAEMHPVHSRIH